MLSTMMRRLISVIHPRLRVAIAVLWLAGAAIAATICVRATARMGLGSGTVFAVVAFGLTVLALGTLRAARWALTISIALAAAQLLGALGAAWELTQDGQTPKTRELHALGINATFGIALNLAYTCVAASLFLWTLIRKSSRERAS
jgi:hypothetical protein